MTGISEQDLAAIREQGDLKEFMRQISAAGKERCARRRALVHKHPDLVARLADIPGQGNWNGYIAPAEWNGAPNTSHIRAALLAIVAEAESRATTSQQGRTAA